MIPTYNQSKYIAQAIQSAQQIDYENLEIVVSDDCSTDNTEEVVVQFLNDKRVKYFKNEPNLGRVANYRKTLYEYASGDYVLNLDGDDWLEDTSFINDAMKLFDENLEVSCVLGDRKNYNEKENTFRLFTNKDNPYIKSIMKGNDFFINYPKINFIFSHFSCIYRRDLAKKLNFYSKDIVSSDIESIMKLYIGNKVGYIPKVVGVWRAHSSNESYTRDVKGIIENLSKYDGSFEIAKDKKIFSDKVLKSWLFNMKKSNLSQDILYEFRSFGLIKSPYFIYKIVKYDIILSLVSFTLALKKIYTKVLKKDKK